MEKICSYHISSMTPTIHTNTCTTWYSLQSFCIHNKIIAVLQWQQFLTPTLTSLEEEKASLFIARLAKRGACLTKRETEANRESSSCRSGGFAPLFSLLHTCGSIWELFDGWFSSLSEVSLRFAVPVQLDSIHHQIRLSSPSD